MNLDIGKAAEHVKDADSFEIPRFLASQLPASMQGPHPGMLKLPAWDFELFGRTIHFQLTKFMVLELAVAVLMILIFVPLARSVRDGRPPKGRLWNLFEMILVYIRDQMAKPAIGHGAERFLPFLWTVFFFVLLCNLFGLVPWAGSPTGALAVTTVLAVSTFAVVLIGGIGHYGPVRFWIGLVPHMDLPPIMAVILKPLIFFLELIGLLIRHGVLAIRLLANMFAGHLVLGVILGFILATANTWLWWGVAPASILGATALNLLELLVAFLQAYIFTFLSALFIGMAVHQH